MSADAHGRNATSNGGGQSKRAQAARLKSDIQDALTGLAAGETTSHQLAGLVRQAIDGGGIYQLLNELDVGRGHTGGVRHRRRSAPQRMPPP